MPAFAYAYQACLWSTICSVYCYFRICI